MLASVLFGDSTYFSFLRKASCKLSIRPIIKFLSDDYICHDYNPSLLLDLKFDSDDDFRTGCRNASHHYRQQSFSVLHSPGRSKYATTCYPRVQTIYWKCYVVWCRIESYHNFHLTLFIIACRDFNSVG